MNSTIRRLFTLVAVTLLCAGAGLAKADFSGNWKMDPARSDFGPLPAPDVLTMKIAHKEPALEVDSRQNGIQGDVKALLKYTTDGQECTNTIRDTPIKSTVNWESGILRIVSKLNFQGNAVTVDDRWLLGTDGGTFTVDRQISSEQGDITMKIVMVKDTGAPVASAAPALAVPVAASTTGRVPNFAGTWKMDASKSDFGPLPAPTVFIRSVKHNDPVLEVETTQSGRQGEVVSTLKYRTDGSESMNTIRGAEVKSTAQWDGSTLVIKYDRSTPQGQITGEERWVLSPDGNTTSVDANITGSFGEVQMKLVLNKQ
jgi:hypothetical protein